MTDLFFAVVGMVYDRAHTRSIPELGGLFRKMPVAAIGFIIAGLVSMGMPGFSGFVAEFPIFMGAWKTYPIVAIIAVLGVIVTAGYIFLVIGRVFFGTIPEKLAKMVGDISLMDKLVVGVLAALMVLIGVFPTLSKMAPMIQSGVAPILALVGGA
jgi:NADH-quinone oxidoreductase subunit M